MKPILKFGVVMIVLTAFVAVVAVWAWAIFGMDKDVGAATGVTLTITGLAGFICLAIGDLG